MRFVSGIRKIINRTGLFNVILVLSLILSSFSDIYSNSQIETINKDLQHAITGVSPALNNDAKFEKTSISSFHNNGAIVRQQSGKRNLQKVFKIDVLSEVLYKIPKQNSYLKSEVTIFDIDNNRRNTIIYIHNKDGKKA